MLQNLSSIDTNSHEGKYLMAAMDMLTTESHTTETPDRVLELVGELAEKMYGKMPEQVATERLIFPKALAMLINSYSLENHSDTPDFILAEYMCDCFHAFNRASNDRERWYGRKQPHPAQSNP